MQKITNQLAFGLFGCGVLIASHAQAANLPVGGAILAPGEPDPTGGAVVAGVATPFVTATFSGTLTSQVIVGDPSNPFGGLTFTYRLTNNVISANAEERLTVSKFTGFLTDVSYQIPIAGVTPVSIDRTTADVVGFSFQPPFGTPIFPGQTSDLLVVQTDALSFQPSIASVIDATTASPASFAPSALPEPASAALATGFGTLLVARRRGR